MPPDLSREKSQCDNNHIQISKSHFVAFHVVNIWLKVYIFTDIHNPIASHNQALTLTMTALDHIITFWLVIFALVAFTFEPVLVFVCKGNLDSCQENELEHNHITKLLIELWFWYAKQFDPLFINTPFWLVIMCGIDCVIFGPMYIIVLFGWIYDSSGIWFKRFVCIWNGALVYSTVVYFAYEILIEYQRNSMFWVIVINMPWTIVPLLLLKQVLISETKHKQYHKKNN